MKTLEVVCCRSLYGSPNREELSVKDALFVLKTAKPSLLLGALCPRRETRGTSGVSLFLLNPQGASVYRAPKYEPIFSITPRLLEEALLYKC